MASADCIQRGGTLARPQTSEELTALNTEDWDTFWLSYNDKQEEGVWVDELGNALPEGMWGWNEPNNAGNEDCAVKLNDGKLNDIYCDLERNYYCAIVGKSFKLIPQL